MEWEDILRDVQSRDWGSLDELNGHLAEKARAYNTAPQRRLSGLWPQQAGRLFADDWEGGGPLRLNEKIPLSELRRARFLVNARVVLSTLEETGPVKATASTRRFPRSFVAAAMNRMERGDRLEELARTYKGVIKQNTALQQTIAMTFYRLRRVGRSWKNPDVIAEDVLMEEALDQPPDYGGENEAYGQFESRVLRPLRGFGLVEKRAAEETSRSLPRHTYRISPLFGRFIRFEKDLGRIGSPSGSGGTADRSSRNRANR